MSPLINYNNYKENLDNILDDLETQLFSLEVDGYEIKINAKLLCSFSDNFGTKYSIYSMKSDSWLLYIEENNVKSYSKRKSYQDMLSELQRNMSRIADNYNMEKFIDSIIQTS